jgi:signal transduction histidine kinase
MANSDRLSPRDRALVLRVGLGVAAATTVLVAVMHYALGRSEWAQRVGVASPTRPLWELLALETPVWFGALLLVPPLLRLADRFPVVGPRRWANLGVHLVAFAIAVLAESVIVTLGRWPLAGLEPGGFLVHVAIYCVILAAVLPAYYALILFAHHALRHARELRRRELDEARLESSLARARLEALRSQMQPHFLFNALNGISGLIGSDDERARRLLAELGDLLRDALDGDGEEVELGEELAMLDRYVALQSARYGDRLRFVHQVPAETLELVVPRFVLQPLVENAVKHGVERRIAPVEVRVEACLGRGMLTLKVADDGPGLAEGAREGVGLRNLRERLAVLYGEAHSLRLVRRPGGGTEATVVLPAAGSSVRPAREAAPG